MEINNYRDQIDYWRSKSRKANRSYKADNIIKPHLDIREYASKIGNQIIYRAMNREDHRILSETSSTSFFKSTTNMTIYGGCIKPVTISLHTVAYPTDDLLYDEVSKRLAVAWEKWIFNGMHPESILNHSDLISKKSSLKDVGGYIIHDPNEPSDNSLAEALYTLPKEFLINAKWYVNPMYLDDVSELLGKEVVLTTAIPTKKIPIVFADLKEGYQSIFVHDHFDMSIQDDIFSITFYIGGGVKRPEAFKVLKITD